MIREFHHVMSRICFTFQERVVKSRRLHPRKLIWTLQDLQDEVGICLGHEFSKHQSCSQILRIILGWLHLRSSLLSAHLSCTRMVTYNSRKQKKASANTENMKHKKMSLHPPKNNMEHENTPLEKEKHLPTTNFGFDVSFRGCILLAN